jgi:hypothetical protein
MSNGQEWWFVRIELPREVFRLDFVVQDLAGQVVDNNGFKVRRGG